ncbi:uncharacterized protein BXZ73DRAFT_78027 [Epithele typhae]|uniref:uncharacterized protein n=1 Tax=Epithele typhae TaxID=378194 RepID=UPI002007E404|nr:uncharacterized protein BXZ73DRAFT_78027 [Epithele typhae]KAH9929922.1 hypothetical protein BXZ73DRAFT_78027 [Epithele typhae]
MLARLDVPGKGVGMTQRQGDILKMANYITLHGLSPPENKVAAGRLRDEWQRAAGGDEDKSDMVRPLGVLMPVHAAAGVDNNAPAQERAGATMPPGARNGVDVLTPGKAHVLALACHANRMGMKAEYACPSASMGNACVFSTENNIGRGTARARQACLISCAARHPNQRGGCQCASSGRGRWCGPAWRKRTWSILPSWPKSESRGWMGTVCVRSADGVEKVAPAPNAECAMVVQRTANGEEHGIGVCAEEDEVERLTAAAMRRAMYPSVALSGGKSAESPSWPERPQDPGVLDVVLVGGELVFSERYVGLRGPYESELGLGRQCGGGETDGVGVIVDADGEPEVVGEVAAVAEMAIADVEPARIFLSSSPFVAM